MSLSPKISSASLSEELRQQNADIDEIVADLGRNVDVVRASMVCHDLYSELLERLPPEVKSALTSFSEHLAVILSENTRRFVDAILGDRLTETELSCEAVPPPLCAGLVDGNEGPMRRLLAESEPVRLYLLKRLKESRDAFDQATMLWTHLHPVDVAAELRSSQAAVSSPRTMMGTATPTDCLCNIQPEPRLRRLLLLNLQLRFPDDQARWCGYLQVRDSVCEQIACCSSTSTALDAITGSLISRLNVVNVRSTPDELGESYRDAMLRARAGVLGVLAQEDQENCGSAAVSVAKTLGDILAQGVRELSKI
eukprot:PhM_4_TR7456/c0_g1_i1/m.60938